MNLRHLTKIYNEKIKGENLGKRGGCAKYKVEHKIWL